MGRKKDTVLEQSFHRQSGGGKKKSEVGNALDPAQKKRRDKRKGSQRKSNAGHPESVRKITCVRRKEKKQKKAGKPLPAEAGVSPSSGGVRNDHRREKKKMEGRKDEK